MWVNNDLFFATRIQIRTRPNDTDPQHWFFTIEYELCWPEEPGRDPRGIKVRHLVVDVHELLVLGDHGVLRVGVVVDRGVGRHLNINNKH